MGSSNLADLVKMGMDHEDDGNGGGEFASFPDGKPPAGLNLKVKVVRANTDDGNDGAPRWGVWFEVVSGEHQGKRFWFNIRFSAAHAFINKEALNHFAALGMSAEFIGGSDPETIASALEGKTTVVATAYRKDKKRKDNDGNPMMWDNHKLSAPVSEAPPVVSDDDDEDWDDED